MVPIGEDWEAYCIEDQPPLGKADAVDQVAQDLECFDGCLGPVAHDVNMSGPLESVVDVEAKVAYGCGGLHSVVQGDGWDVEVNG